MIFRKGHRGFTLIEIMVALAVLAIGMAAVLRSTAQASHGAILLKQKTIAHWVASNRAAEFSLEQQWPALGTTTGTETMANQVWQWEAEAQSTDIAELRRIDIRVSLEGDELTRFTTFLGKP